MPNDYKITYTFCLQTPEEFHKQIHNWYPDKVEDTTLAKNMLKRIGVKTIY